VVLPLSYRLKLRFEQLQVVFAWGLSYLWVLPYILYNITFPFVILILVVDTSHEFSGQEKTAMVVIMIFMMALFNLPALHVLLKVRKEYRAARNLSELESMPEPAAGLIRRRIEELAKRTDRKYHRRIDRCFLRLFLERRNHKATPCMMVTSGMLNLIFPLGFLRVLKADPEGADAMLAHELAHYLHRDSGMLLWVRCYLKAARVVFGYAIAGLVLTIVFAAFKWSMTPTVYQAEYNRYRYASIADAILQERLHLVLIVGLQFAVILYYFLLFSYLRRRVHRSEALADLLAAIVIGPGPVKRFLNDYIVDREGESPSLHPPVNHRIRYLEKFERRSAT
jgi:Zn-dependent protease with chaperone function